MRYLDFNVVGMVLTKPKTTDLGGLIAGSKGYLAVKLNFDSDWNGLNKAVVWIGGHREHPVAVKNGVAVMDDYTASKAKVGFYVVGQSTDKSTRVQTNTFWFEQNVGGVKNGRN